MVLALGLSAVIGLLLGLLGGGGSILTVPVLVYLLGVEPKTAIVTSFVVVGVSSLMALIPHARRRSVCWKSGVFFGLAGMSGAFVGGRMASHFPNDVLMLLFGIVSLFTGALMLFDKRVRNGKLGGGETVALCPLQVPYLRVLFDGLFVGALTGMVGVGGGFLIVPALTMLVGLPMQGAVGTSLMIIAMNALAGLSGYSQHIDLDAGLTLIFAIGAITGSAAGAWVSAYVSPGWLRRGFGVMVVGVAGYVLSQAVTAELLADVEQMVSNPQGPIKVLVGLLLVLVLIRIGAWIHKFDHIVFSPNGGPR